LDKRSGAALLFRGVGCRTQSGERGTRPLPDGRMASGDAHRVGAVRSRSRRCSSALWFSLKQRNSSHDFPRRVHPLRRPHSGDWPLPRPHLELRKIATCAWSLLGRRASRTSALVAAARSPRRPGRCGTLADDGVVTRRRMQRGEPRSAQPTVPREKNQRDSDSGNARQSLEDPYGEHWRPRLIRRAQPFDAEPLDGEPSEQRQHPHQVSKESNRSHRHE
jgi:hypothetical protein